MRYIYGERTPSFTELARERVEIGWSRPRKGASLLVRLHALFRAWVFWRAAHWQSFLSRGLGHFFTRYLMLRIAPLIACAILAWYLMGVDAEEQTSGALITLAYSTFLLTLLWGVWAWMWGKLQLELASRYRVERQDTEQQLRSTDGLNGWRAVPSAEGGWELVEVAAPSADAPAA